MCVYMCIDFKLVLPFLLVSVLYHMVTVSCQKIKILLDHMKSPANGRKVKTFDQGICDSDAFEDSSTWLNTPILKTGHILK